MDFTIYSIGSGAYLHQILMAVVSFTSDDSFGTFIRIGLLLGVLFFAFQAISSGGSQLNVGQLVVAALLYALMFGPKADVYVHGLYDGYGGAVEDVPIGIAMPGAFVSQLGYGLTSKFETAFSGPGSDRGLTDGGGYADALKILNDIRRKSDDPKIMSALNASAGEGSDFRTSWTNYVRECTAIKIDLGEATVDEIYSADDIFSDDGLKFASTLFGTNIIMNGNQTPMDCTTAYSTLKGWTESATSGGAPVYAEYKRILGLGEPEGTAGGDELDVDASYDDAFESIQGSMTAMDALADAATMAQQYVRTSILETIFQEGMAGRYEDLRDFSTASMINSAIDQRNIQWASEQTMFMSIVRPMLTFIEGFAYAITPFMAFIIVLGGFGIKLAMKYGQMLLWIQLWLPVLAITNFFLYMVASHDLGQIENYSTSFYAINAADARLANWVAVGGMLAAATPILTLVLLTGSAYAMTSLAQRMQGADHVNEKTQSPDTVQQGAVLDQAAMNTSSALGGRSATGSKDSIGSLNLKEMSQSGYSSSSAELDQTTNTLMGQVSESFKSGSTKAATDMSATTTTDALSATSTDSARALKQGAQQWGLDNGFTQSESNTIGASIATVLSGGTPPALPASIQEKLETKLGHSYSEGFSQSDIDSISGGISWSSEDSAAYATSLSKQLQDTDQVSLQEAVGSENANALTTSAAEVTQANEQYQESKQYANSSEMSQSVDLQEAGARLNRDESARNILDGFYSGRSDLAAMAQDRADQWTQTAQENGRDMNAGVALQAARLQVASEQANYHGDSAAYNEGRDTVLEAMGEALGTNPSSQGNAAENEGVSGTQQSATAAAGDYQRDVGPAPQDLVTESVAGRNAENMAGVDESKDAFRAEHASATYQEDVAQALDGGNPPQKNSLLSMISNAQGSFWGGGSAENTVANATGLSAGQVSNLPDNLEKTLGDGAPVTAFKERMEAAAAGDAASAHMVSQSLGLNGNEQAQAFSQGFLGQDNTTSPGNEVLHGLGGRMSEPNADTQMVAEHMAADAVISGASANGLSEGAATVQASAMFSDTNTRQAVFDAGIDAYESEIANRKGVTVEELTSDDKQFVNALAQEALSTDGSGRTSDLNTSHYQSLQGL